ncbi:uncharacterized protein LOC143718602 isoform X2 [Siphateles boraxobius]|uniref:uncharacterized protein LOC143718602 isoform X2 n=1 Tax=Siphateles boraxobius TaxID=180520 RepID=UPI0040649926
MKVLVVHILLFLLLLNQRNINMASAQCSGPPVLCCAGQNNGCNRGCYCDEFCIPSGDCCPDYHQTCHQSNPHPSSPSLATTTPHSPTLASSSSLPNTSSSLPDTSSPSSSLPDTSSTSSLPVTSSPSSSLPVTSSSSSSLPVTSSSSSSLPVTSSSSSSLPVTSSSSSSLPVTLSSQTSAPSSSSQSTTSPTSSSIASLSGQCSVPTVLCCAGHNNECNRGCYCDEVCVLIGDCCPDYQQTCIQPHSQPSSTSSTSLATTPHSPTLSSSSSLPVTSSSSSLPITLSSQTSGPSSSSQSTTSPTSSSIASPSVCSTCTENEDCQERGGVYGCYCLQGQRPNPENFDAVESCASSTGSISLSRCQLFESGFYPEHLHLNDPSCTGTLEDGRLLFHFDNEGNICGTTLMSNRTHFIYQNSIQSTPTDTDHSIISREIWMNITFSCAYPMIQTISMPTGFRAEGGVISEELPAGQGTYQIRMIPYHDAEFTSPYDGEVQMQVNQQIYVAVEVEGVDRNQIATVLDNCWATPVNDAEYHVRWNLVIGECPNPEDTTVEVLQNGFETTSHFSFRMFTFSGISDNFFLHCQIHLCLVQNGRCALLCDPGYRRRRHRSLDFLHSSAISMGLKAQ